MFKWWPAKKRSNKRKKRNDIGKVDESVVESLSRVHSTTQLSAVHTPAAVSVSKDINDLKKEYEEIQARLKSTLGSSRESDRIQMRSLKLRNNNLIKEVNRLKKEVEANQLKINELNHSIDQYNLQKKQLEQTRAIITEPLEQLRDDFIKLPENDEKKEELSLQIQEYAHQRNIYDEKLKELKGGFLEGSIAKQKNNIEKNNSDSFKKIIKLNEEIQNNESAIAQSNKQIEEINEQLISLFGSNKIIGQVKLKANSAYFYFSSRLFGENDDQEKMDLQSVNSFFKKMDSQFTVLTSAFNAAFDTVRENYLQSHFLSQVVDVRNFYFDHLSDGPSAVTKEFSFNKNWKFDQLMSNVTEQIYIDGLANITILVHMRSKKSIEYVKYFRNEKLFRHSFFSRNNELILDQFANANDDQQVNSKSFYNFGGKKLFDFIHVGDGEIIQFLDDQGIVTKEFSSEQDMYYQWLKGNEKLSNGHLVMKLTDPLMPHIMKQNGFEFDVLPIVENFKDVKLLQEFVLQTSKTPQILTVSDELKEQLISELNSDVDISVVEFKPAFKSTIDYKSENIKTKASVDKVI